MNPSTWRHPETDLPKVIIDEPEETSFLIFDRPLTSGATHPGESPYESTLRGVDVR